MNWVCIQCKVNWVCTQCKVNWLCTQCNANLVCTQCKVNQVWIQRKVDWVCIQYKVNWVCIQCKVNWVCTQCKVNWVCDIVRWTEFAYSVKGTEFAYSAKLTEFVHCVKGTEFTVPSEVNLHTVWSVCVAGIPWTALQRQQHQSVGAAGHDETGQSLLLLVLVPCFLQWWFVLLLCWIPFNSWLSEHKLHYSWLSVTKWVQYSWWSCRGSRRKVNSA